jgi:hypothetical protein
MSGPDFFTINGLNPNAYKFPFPAVEIQTFHDLRPDVEAYIEKLEVALGQAELLVERLNTDRIEVRRVLRMRDYANRLSEATGEPTE